MDKSTIIREIKRMAAENGGVPPGRGVFERKTGITQPEWYPRLWLRWGEALEEAGFPRHRLQGRIDDDVVLDRYVTLVRELGHFPVAGELRRKASEDKSFPSHTIFLRFGGKQKLIDRAAQYCRESKGFEDVLALAEASSVVATELAPKPSNRPATGFVYLMKSGRHYKIGRTNSTGRRGRELAIKIPVPPTTLHSIETDDPSGIEAYWHRRFAEKRGEGEWFELNSEDVRAFKRWKRIV